MAYKVIILYRLYMPSYFLGTFTEYPKIEACWTMSGRLLLCINTLLSYRSFSLDILFQEH